MTKNLKVSAICIVLSLLIVAFAVYYKSRTSAIGGFDIKLPAADRHEYNGGAHAGNVETFVVKGKTTFIHIEFDNLMQHGTIQDVASLAQDARSDEKMTMFRDKMKEVHFMPFSNGKIDGYYLLRYVKQVHGGTGDQREIFFLKSGVPYTLRFSFTQTNYAPDKNNINATWLDLLRQIGISPSVLPTQ